MTEEDTDSRLIPGETKWDELTRAEKIHQEIRLVILNWCEELGIKQDWPTNAHCADILDKRIFPEIKKRLAQTS